MDYIFFREHEPLPDKLDSPRWYAIRRAIKFAKKFDNVTYITSGFDHYTKKKKVIPDWLLDAELSIVLVPSIGYSHNKSIFRLLNTLLYNLYSYIYLIFKKKSFVFFSGPTLGVFCLPLAPILRHNIHSELRDCWPLISRPKHFSIFGNLRFNLLMFFARLAYKNCSNKISIRCTSLGVYQFISNIISNPARSLYRPFISENYKSCDSIRIKKKALFAGTFEEGFDENEFERILSEPLCRDLDITIIGYGAKSNIVEELSKNINNVTFLGKATHSEVRRRLGETSFLLCFYPKNVGFENHRTNKIMEAESHDLKIISNIPLDTKLQVIVV